MKIHGFKYYFCKAKNLYLGFIINSKNFENSNII